MKKLLFGQKITAFILTLVLFSSFNLYWKVMFAILLGHPHFLLAHLYKAAAKKYSYRQVIYLIISGVLLYVFLVIPKTYARSELLLYITTVVGAYHFIIDDHHTLNFFKSGYESFEKLEIISLLLFVLALQTQWQYNSPLSFIFIVPGICTVVLYTLLLLKARKLTMYRFCFILMIIGVLFIIPFRSEFFGYDKFFILTFIGVYHYFLFYFHYYTKLQNISKKAKSLPFLFTVKGYLSAVFIANLLFLILYYFSYNDPYILNGFIFDGHIFYILALVHFFSSMRGEDIRDLKVVFQPKWWAGLGRV
ncbi:MAG: hypothetical protein AAB966_02330 [Patescibacteria group bacterium]